ncbi:MAG: phosphate ABC transporter permease subunit PstC [Candidatus Desulforudis sp.]|nr:phosphate ABC transporter permease subunit PstC [Desulforudis sp.]
MSNKKEYALDRFFGYVFVVSAVLVSLVIFSIIVFVAKQGLQTFGDIGFLEFHLGTDWDPPYRFGALPFILGSLGVTFLAVVLGAPLGLAGAIFMAKIAPPRVRELMRPATDLFVGIPSVVYGWVGLTILVPFVAERTGGFGFGLLVAGVLLAVMILPTVISISEDALRAVPRRLEMASYALGATRWQTIFRVLIPAALPGLVTAVILGMARAIGETMAVAMLIGNVPQIAKSLLEPTSTLTAEIILNMGQTPFGSTWNNALFYMALTLLLVSMFLIILIRFVVQRRTYDG